MTFEPNHAVLAITRLYLEKYEMLAAEDKAVYRDVIRSFSVPTFVSPSQVDVDEYKQRVEAGK